MLSWDEPLVKPRPSYLEEVVWIIASKGFSVINVATYGFNVNPKAIHAPLEEVVDAEIFLAAKISAFEETLLQFSMFLTTWIVGHSVRAPPKTYNLVDIK